MKLRRCPSPASLSIRTRLLLLVLVVWLPAAIAFGVLARDTYVRESAAVRARIEAVARSISSVLEREFDKRALLGATLAASRSSPNPPCTSTRAGRWRGAPRWACTSRSTASRGSS